MTFITKTYHCEHLKLLLRKFSLPFMTFAASIVEFLFTDRILILIKFITLCRSFKNCWCFLGRKDLLLILIIWICFMPLVSWKEILDKDGKFRVRIMSLFFLSDLPKFFFKPWINLSCLFYPKGFSSSNTES